MHHYTSTKIQKKYYEHHYYITFYRAESQKLYKHCRATSNFAQNHDPKNTSHKRNIEEHNAGGKGE